MGFWRRLFGGSGTDELNPQRLDYLNEALALERQGDYDAARRSDTGRFGRFFWAMMDRGVYLPCSQFEAAFLSAAHTDADVQQTLAAAREALATIG